MAQKLIKAAAGDLVPMSLQECADWMTRESEPPKPLHCAWCHRELPPFRTGRPGRSFCRMPRRCQPEFDRAARRLGAAYLQGGPEAAAAIAKGLKRSTT